MKCNCFGARGQFELDQDFHEMGIDGCVGKKKVDFNSWECAIVGDRDYAEGMKHVLRVIWQFVENEEKELINCLKDLEKEATRRINDSKEARKRFA